ncbi:NTP transferase domain-containing protein, partial [bacterium]|nr:NTP transferase domain-containing protein [bacterium]
MNFPIKKAIILAGGEGTRLRPMTYNIPKSLVPMQGKTLTELVLDILKKYEVKDIV